HHRPLTVHLRRPAARAWHTSGDPSRAAGASGSLGAETRAQRAEDVLGRAGDVVDLAIDQAHRGRVGRLPGNADDGARPQPDVPVIGLEVDEVTHGRSPFGVTAVIAPWTAPRRLLSRLARAPWFAVRRPGG